VQATAPDPRSYRCSYYPKDSNGWLVPCDSGVLPTVQVQAVNAEAARQLAYATTGCPVGDVLRIEPIEIPAPGVAMSADLRAWLRGRPAAAAEVA
jgi:hypothetical protein